jgi:hypothetical protein
MHDVLAEIETILETLVPFQTTEECY